MGKILLGLIFLFFFSVTQVYAHSGGLDKNGGHYCRDINGCGEYKYNEYHCHSATCTLPSETQGPSSTPTPTPVSTTTPAQPISNNFNIQLSEIYPAPNSGDKEWVEVYNPNSEIVNLSGWKFQDGSGRKEDLGSSLVPHGWAFFEYSSGWLNNSGDSLSLLNPDGQIVESYTYGKTAKGTSWAKDSNGVWQQTSTPTKGWGNIITTPAVEEKSSGVSSKSKTTTKTESPKPTPVGGTTPQTLGKKVTTSKNVSGVSSEQDFATPSFNLATISAEESSPEATVAGSKTSKLGAILAILGGLVILGVAAFTLAKKLEWKF